MDKKKKREKETDRRIMKETKKNLKKQNKI